MDMKNFPRLCYSMPRHVLSSYKINGVDEKGKDVFILAGVRDFKSAEIEVYQVL